MGRYYLELEWNTFLLSRAILTDIVFALLLFLSRETGKQEKKTNREQEIASSVMVVYGKYRGKQNRRTKKSGKLD